MALVHMNTTDAADALYNLFSQHHPAQVTIDTIVQAGWTQNSAHRALEVLRRRQRIKAYPAPDGTPIFEYVPPEIARRLQTIQDPNALKIYRHIESKTDQGA